MIAPWARQYFGIPFKPHGRDRGGLDCWGLLRLVYMDQFGIDLPSFSERYASTEDEKELGRLISGELGPWRPVTGGEELPGDGVLLRVKGEPMHVGVVIGGGFMMHVMRGMDVARERYQSRGWRKRVLGFYRHEAMK